MPAPRRFPGLHDGPPRPSANDGRTFWPTAAPKPNLISPDTAHRWLTDSAVKVWPSVAGYNDPIAIACVVEGLLRLDADSLISAKDLVPLLTRWYPHFYWKTITIGKILGSLVEAAREVDDETPPLGMVASHAGYRYHVSTEPRHLMWLARARDNLIPITEQALEHVRATGRRATQTSFPWTAFPDHIEAYKKAAS